MAFVAFNNTVGLMVTLTSSFPEMSNIPQSIMNALGESLAHVGRVYLSSGPGTSKTLSSAGGKIVIVLQTVTWATAGTTVRVGIQDVNTTTGLEVGTFDVFKDLVQGTDAMAVGFREVTMASGTKTITHGDLIAVVSEMTVRNGADSLGISFTGFSANFPYLTTDVATLAKSAAGGPFCTIRCDDGTLGHFGDWTVPNTVTTPLISSATTPDEYAMVFQLPFTCTINAVFLRIGDVDAGDEATVHLIQDPFGAITNLQTVTLASGLQAQTGGVIGNTTVEMPATTLVANTVYAVSYRPTTTGTRLVRLLNFFDANARFLLPMLASGATRTDLGAFTNSPTVIPDFGIRVNTIDVSGGAGTSVAYVG
jgi:hypothetical protein